MKNHSTLLIALCSTGFIFGCATNPANSAFGSSDSISISLKKFIDTAQSLYKRGRELQRESRITEAEQYYQQALSVEPQHMDTQNALAALHASRGDVDRAISLLSMLAEAHPEVAHVHANLGYAYYLKGQYVLAQESLERATMLDPSNENSWSKLDKVNAEIYRQEMLAHSVADNTELAQSADAIGIKSVMPGVYVLRYADEPKSAQIAPTAVTEPEVQQRPLPVTSQATAAGRVELVNGNGVTGLARALRGLIADKQWKVVRTRNNDQFSVKTTRIEYASSYYPAARQLADTIAVDAVLRLNDHQDGSNLRVVLGHDFKSVEPLRQRVAGMPAAEAY